MDQSCSHSPRGEVERSSPSKPPLVEFEQVDKVTSSDRAESPDTNCAICLGKLQNKSFTDSCLHQFCFTCLLEWSKVKAECPLCKQNFKSIIHNVRSIEDYDQYHLRPSEQRVPLQTFSLSLTSDDQPRFRYRTTMVQGQPLYGYLQRLEHMMSHGEMIPPAFLTHHHRRSSWRSHHLPSVSGGNSGSRRPRLMSPDFFDSAVPGTSGFRRHIYNNNLWVRRIPDVTGRFRECSAEFFLNNPAQAHRLVPWLNRELNVLLHGTEHDTVSFVGVILDLLPRYNIRSQEFRSTLFQYLGDRTDHFTHELYAFGSSPYDMVGYDRICLYGPRFQYSDNDLSDSSSDSDIQIVEVVQNETATDVPSSLSHTQEVSPIPGPSYSLDNENTLIAVSSEEDSNESDCQIVGTVKPRHLRTPEIINLVDDSDSNVMFTVPDKPQISAGSESEVDHKPILHNRTAVLREANKTMMSRCQHHGFPSRSISFCSSSEESSGEDWNPQRRRPSIRKYKIGRKEQNDPMKKRDKEPFRKKKIIKEKKSKILKQHWKKKLCRKIESTSCSSDEGPILPYSNKKRKFISSSSTSEGDEKLKKVDHNYVIPYCERNRKKGSASRLKSVVHVKQISHQNNDPLVQDDAKGKGSSVSSVTSSRCSMPSTSSHCSGNYTALMIPNGDYSARILLRRNRLCRASVSSTSSTSSLLSSSSCPSYQSSRKHRHKKVKSKKRHS